MFKTLHHVWNLFRFWAQKIGLFFKQTFSGISQLPSVRPEEICGKWFLFQEEFMFFVWVLELQQFFSAPWQICYLGEPKQQCTCLEETIVGTLLWKTVFFLNCLDFEQKNLEFLWKNNGTFFKTVAYVSVQKMFRKKDLDSWILIYFDCWPEKNLEFTVQNWAGMSKLNSMCPEEHLQSNVSDRNCSKFQGFRLNYEVSGTLTKIFLQGCQNREKSPEEHIKESPLSKRKNLLTS